MPPFDLLLQAAASGFALYALFWLWKKGASRWSTWFPLLKKGLEWSLIASAVIWLFYSVSFYSQIATAQLPPLALCFVLGLALPALVTKRQGKEKEETKRGSELATAKKVTQLVKATRRPANLDLGGVPLPFDAEPYHLLVAGSTGTGKSVAISTLLDALQARNDTVILVDSGGGFLSKYYREGVDFIFNPYDDRCVGWSPTAEMSGAWDAQALARSIVPDGTGDSKEWNNYAQTFVASVLRRLWETKRLSLRDFLYYVQAASISELEELLQGTAASSQLASEKTFGSIRTIAGNYISSYDYLPTNKDSFSVADMIRAEHSGTLFVTYRDDQLDGLRSLMGCLLDVAARTILSLEPDPNRRVWLIIDEFASIGKVQSIEQVATKARKAGGCLVIGLQSISQLKDRYGEHGAQTILSCLSTWLVLRCSDADTADYMSKYIGEAEVQKSNRSNSNSDSGGSESWSEQSSTQRVVLASEIQAYANLNGLLKLAGDFPVCEVKLRFPAKRKDGEPSFVPRDFERNPLLKLTSPAKVTPPAVSAPQATASANPALSQRRKERLAEDEVDRRKAVPVSMSVKSMGAGFKAPAPLPDEPEEAQPNEPRPLGKPAAAFVPPPERQLTPSSSQTLDDAQTLDELLDGPGFFELPSSKKRKKDALQATTRQAQALKPPAPVLVQEKRIQRPVAAVGVSGAVTASAQAGAPARLPAVAVSTAASEPDEDPVFGASTPVTPGTEGTLGMPPIEAVQILAQSATHRQQPGPAAKNQGARRDQAPADRPTNRSSQAPRQGGARTGGSPGRGASQNPGQPGRSQSGSAPDERQSAPDASKKPKQNNRALLDLLR